MRCGCGCRRKWTFWGGCGSVRPWRWEALRAGGLRGACCVLCLPGGPRGGRDLEILIDCPVVVLMCPEGVVAAAERALWCAALGRRRAACVLSVLLFGAGGLYAAWYLGFPWAPAAVFWVLAGAGACSVVFLAWFLAALLVDLAVSPCGRRRVVLESAGRKR